MLDEPVELEAGDADRISLVVLLVDLVHHVSREVEGLHGPVAQATAAPEAVVLLSLLLVVLLLVLFIQRHFDVALQVVLRLHLMHRVEVEVVVDVGGVRRLHVENVVVLS